MSLRKRVGTWLDKPIKNRARLIENLKWILAGAAFSQGVGFGCIALLIVMKHTHVFDERDLERRDPVEGEN